MEQNDGFKRAIESAASELSGQRQQINNAWEALRVSLKTMHPDFDLDDDGMVHRAITTTRNGEDRRAEEPLTTGGWLCGNCEHWNTRQATVCRVCTGLREEVESARVEPVSRPQAPAEEPAGDEPPPRVTTGDTGATSAEEDEGTEPAGEPDRATEAPSEPARPTGPPAEKRVKQPGPDVNQWRRPIVETERRRYIVFLAVEAMRNLTVQEVIKLLGEQETDANKGKYGDDLRELAKRGSLKTDGTRWPEGTTTGKKSLAYVPSGLFKDRDGNRWDQSPAFDPELALPPQ